jgi:hypothetical protein
MVDNAHAFLDDPFGCTADLRDAATDPDLDRVEADGQAGPDGARAAYRLALTLGRCRLFGVAPGEELDGVLPPHLGLAAANELARILRGRAGDAAQLGERWDRAVDPAEADNLCAGLLGTRMEAWAVGIALDEAQLDCAEEGDTRAGALAAAIDRVQDALDRFDADLEAQAEVLATITATRLLDNWRAMLAAPHKDNLPWWLDGRLEEVARHSQEESVRTLPGPGTWASPGRSRRALGPAPAWGWLTEPLMAAAVASPPVVEHRDWQSPQGDCTATLAAVPNPGPTVRVNFYRGAAAARDLAGQSAFLADVPAVIDTDGNADFDVRALRQARDAGRPDTLAVGSPAAAWRPLFGEDGKR